MTPDSALVVTVSPSPNFGDRRGKAIDTLVLHYTGMSTGAAARARLLDPAAQVSCHYLVWEDGRIEQLVAEADRAWHAGRSSWAGESDVNAISVGIEIVNAGHPGGCPPYPAAQIAAVIALCRDVCARHGIVPARVLGHSDVSPDRKNDPGEWFPWQRLAAEGVGLWPSPAASTASGRSLVRDSTGEDVFALQRRLAAFGYDCGTTGTYDDATEAVVTAFQRHYRPSRVDGCADAETQAILVALR